MANTTTPPAPLTRKDFISDQMVRWCPGCGDFAILAQVQKLLPTFNLPREKFVFVSGIGCSSRFPYYVNTYGFHTIHGRAPAIATGVKTARPDLSVWVVTGDGDGLSIGTNHLIHALRRNVDIKILLFNNEIYGLTKGQTSPTSPVGQKTKSTPFGSIDRPIHPIRIAIAAEATFVARTVDTDLDHLGVILERAYKHKGSTFIEIYQNCKVFNDGAFEEVNDKSQRDDHSVKLEHGKPLIFGKAKDKGIRLNGRNPEIVTFAPGKPPADLLVHDEFNPDASFAYMLAQMESPEFPHPLGVFRETQAPTLEDQMNAQRDAAKASSKATLQSLLNGPETWEVQ
jgi:2-oxoglutarate/2-oxoacid ferredoxin oxidoreductase subunit beta